MKSFLRGTTALAGIVIAGSAFAADLPRRAAPPVFVPVPVFTWTGAYFGINAGYGFDAGSNSDRYTLPGGSVLNSFTRTPVVVSTNGGNDLEGFVGGGQVGYNYQFTPGSGVVVGIEADAQYTDFGNKSRTVAGTISPAAGALVSPTSVRIPGNEMNFFGTVRGRIGYAFDRTLVYGTGGFAYGDGATGGDDFRTGYTAGGGIEYALPTDSFFNFFKSSAVTLKVEGLYVNLENDKNNRGGRSVFNSAVAPSGLLTISPAVAARESEFAVVRAGLNYKFGSY
ncbi:porin family protein [Methylobacterium sp. W2]|uniref:outer membrane protein n=1 Tax=Methylobacterium sp. W2 TaxID=2598107 RepID=UPI001D0C4081|nr:porin family protein [Methylobacterium sp. W2]MCC0807041.1 porin family protein [Methylobacterium sp. W2]